MIRAGRHRIEPDGVLVEIELRVVNRERLAAHQPQVQARGQPGDSGYFHPAADRADMAAVHVRRREVVIEIHVRSDLEFRRVALIANDAPGIAERIRRAHAPAVRVCRFSTDRFSAS